MHLLKGLLPAVIFLLLFSSCLRYRKAFYFNPFNGNSATYHTTPLQIDSVKSATYGSMLIGIGGANNEWHDEIVMFRPSIHHSHSGKNYQYYYGGNLTLGNYTVRGYDTITYSTFDYLNPKLINEHTGNKFFGGLGLNSGANYTISFRRRHELRMGAEFSYYHEFGDYIDFRKQLHDTAATIIHRQSPFFTMGVYTELAFKLKKGSIGFKIALGKPFGKNYRKARYSSYTSENFSFVYLSPAFQYTNRRWTGFAQLNIATKAVHAQLGTQYRLAARVKKNE